MSAVIYLVRHGQTVFNAEGRLQGQMDSALTPLGVAQAQRFGAALRPLVGTATFKVIASPLGRARQTASHIAAALPAALSLHFDPDWMEISMGQWDGHTNAEIEAGWPAARDGLAADHWHFHAPGGERFAQIAGRVTRALDAAKSAETEVVIIVTHGITSRVARGLWSGMDFNALAGLPVPQDRLYALRENGHIDTIAVESPPVQTKAESAALRFAPSSGQR